MHYNERNPHPFSTRKTELIWDGKYDERGNRRTLNITAATLPLQLIESVDQPRSEALATGQGELFEKQHQRQDDFRNRLIWGDNRVVMASLRQEFSGKIRLIYGDPPFNVGADFTMELLIGEGKDKIPKQQSALEAVAYSDIWGKGTDSYLHFMYERLTLMRDLLAEDGSIYLHCDPTMSHYLKLLMDEVFGPDQFRNEIVWLYRKWTNAAGYFQRNHDVILFYSKSNGYLFNKLFNPNSPQAAKYERGWDTNRVSGVKQLIVYNEEKAKAEMASGKYDRIVYRLDPEGTAFADWWELNYLSSKSNERLGYPTQKPMQLLERIIKASSNEGDLVFDPFCGSGTTGAVAEALGRRWIMADLGRFSIHTTRKRMIELQRERHADAKPYRSFDVYNAGRYERQWWQKERLKGAEDEHRRVVLELFGAEVLEPQHQPSPYLHGVKDGAYCHVAPIDTIFGRADVEEIAELLNVNLWGGVNQLKSYVSLGNSRWKSTRASRPSKRVTGSRCNSSVSRAR